MELNLDKPTITNHLPGDVMAEITRDLANKPTSRRESALGLRDLRRQKKRPDAGQEWVRWRSPASREVWSCRTFLFLAGPIT